MMPWDIALIRLSTKVCHQASAGFYIDFRRVKCPPELKEQSLLFPEKHHHHHKSRGTRHHLESDLDSPCSWIWRLWASGLWAVVPGQLGSCDGEPSSWYFGGDPPWHQLCILCSYVRDDMFWSPQIDMFGMNPIKLWVQTSHSNFSFLPSDSLVFAKVWNPCHCTFHRVWDQALRHSGRHSNVRDKALCLQNFSEKQISTTAMSVYWCHASFSIFSQTGCSVPDSLVVSSLVWLCYMNDTISLTIH